MMQPMRVVAVDDEPLALRRLERLLGDVPDVDMIGTASSCAEASTLISRTSPDLLLLDIRMRDGTGFDVMQSVECVKCPGVIFVTAFDQYAVDAFKHAAIDYLLKPIDPERLQEALERAKLRGAPDRNQSDIDELEEVIANLREALREKRSRLDDDDIWIRAANGGFSRVALRDIDWVCSEEDYVRLHVGNASYLLRSSIRGLERKFEPGEFVRVHRSALVRLSSIAQVKRSAAGRREVVLQDGTHIPAGRVNFRSLRDIFARNRLLTED